MGVHYEDFFGDYLSNHEADSLHFIRSCLRVAMVDSPPSVVLPLDYCHTMEKVLSAELGRRGRDRNPKGGNAVPQLAVRARPPARGTARMSNQEHDEIAQARAAKNALSVRRRRGLD
jgi:hypothetical protein